MHESRLLLGIAALFAGMTVLMATLGVVYSPLLLIVAALFGVVTYLLWSHGTGRLAARIYRRVERQAAQGGGRRRTRSRRRASDGGFGAGPREEWRGPRSGQRERARQRQRAQGGERRRRTRQQGQRRRAPSTSDRPSAAEAADTLGVPASADQSTIKSAYREKVKEVHPDTEGGDEERFKQVNRAYERLREE